MDRRAFLATDHPRFTVPEIVTRMNWLAEQDEDMRNYLRAVCAADGHVPTGERIMIGNPIDCCWRCGEKYRNG